MIMTFVSDVLLMIIGLAWIGGGVHGFAYINPILACQPITALNDLVVCATGEITGPSPAADMNGTVTYLGGYSYTYQFYQNHCNGTDTSVVDSQPDMTVLVQRNDDDTCSVAINDEPCTICKYCQNDMYLVDCTNVVPYGRMADCEIANENNIFFPLIADAWVNTFNSTSSVESTETSGNSTYDALIASKQSVGTNNGMPMTTTSHSSSKLTTATATVLILTISTTLFF